MLRVETKRIGEHTYRVRQLQLDDALGVLPILLRAIGPTLAAVLDGSKSLEDVLESGTSAAAALREFSRSVSAADLRELSGALIGCSEIEASTNEPGVFVPLSSVAKKHFPPRYQEWLLWLLFAVRVNFSSFLGGAASVANVLAALQKAQASTSPTSSNGTDGAS